MIPNKLQIRGINFCLISKGEKKPFEKEWQKKKIEFDDPRLLEHLNNGGSYGILGGGDAKLLIVDFDIEKYQEDIVPKLPQTFTVKTGRGLLHKYFFSDGTDSFKIFTENLDTILDVQGEGKQVVGAGSIHANGNRYEVIDDSDIAFIGYSELKAIIIPFDRKPKKVIQTSIQITPQEYRHDNFLDFVKSKIPIESVLKEFGVDISKNPTNCMMHDSKGGKCLGFKDEVAHCFHCEGQWNIFSLVKEYKHLDFKGALEWLVDKFNLNTEYLESKKKYFEQQNALTINEKKQLKYDFISLVHGKIPKLNEATELMTDYIKSKIKIYTTKDDVKSEVWVYKEGIYLPNGRSEIKEMLRDILEEFYNNFYANAILTKIETDTYITQEILFKNNYPEEIPVLNGILNVVTKQLQPFTPDKIFFNKLPVTYNPEAECPKIEKFISEVLALPEDKLVFYEIGGYCLLKEYRFEKAFMFVGEGRNGKDKSLELIKRLIGVENCCTVPLSSIIPESFIISEFHNKMANLAGEINNKDLKDASAFKSLTGRSLQLAPRKFLKPVQFVNHAKFIFACNELPMVYENNKGFWDRWVVLEFPYTFLPQNEIDIAKSINDVNLNNLKL